MAITVERNQAGALILSAIIRGYLVRRTYYGYTVREARRMFKAHWTIASDL